MLIDCGCQARGVAQFIVIVSIGISVFFGILDAHLVNQKGFEGFNARA
jgi:hypothetical protein